jgi:hypothetical protein
MRFILGAVGILPVLCTFSTVQESLLRKSVMHPSAISRLFVVPDVHGDYEALLRSLLLAVHNGGETGITYEDLRGRLAYAIDTPRIDLPPPIFSKEKRLVLVQMGDLIDRGIESKRCMQAMAMVEHVIGFSVIQLVGNHEVGALVPDGLYPTNVDPEDDLPRDQTTYGYPNGYMWRYLQENTLIMTRIGGTTLPAIPGVPSSNAATLFVHAGLNLRFIASIPHEEDPSMWFTPLRYNAHWLGILSDPTIKDDKTRIMKLVAWFFANGMGPLETRNLSTQSTNCKEVDILLARFNVARIVVGHTPMVPDRSMQMNCGGKIILTDNAMGRNIMAPRGTVPPPQPVPSILVMKFESGRLVGIESLRIAPGMEEHEVHSMVNPDGTPAMRSLTDPFELPPDERRPKLKRSHSVLNSLETLENLDPGAVKETSAPIMDDGSVRVTPSLKGAVRGLSVTIRGVAEEHIRKVIEEQALKIRIGIPMIEPLSSRNLRVDQSSTQEHTYFLRTNVSRMMAHRDINPSTLRDIESVLAFFHSIGSCVGKSTDPKTLFGINESNNPEFVNFAALHACESGQGLHQMSGIKDFVAHPISSRNI